MDVVAYQVRFVGGPADGLTLEQDADSFVERPLMTMPANPIAIRSADDDGREVVDRYCSTYLLVRRSLKNLDGREAVECQYNFAGFELVRLEPPTIHDRSRRRPWMSRIRGLYSRTRQGLIRWMLAPVERPLRIEPPKQPPRLR
jgi:hypothetical protein